MPQHVTFGMCIFRLVPVSCLRDCFGGELRQKFQIRSDSALQRTLVPSVDVDAGNFSPVLAK